MRLAPSWPVLMMVISSRVDLITLPTIGLLWPSIPGPGRAASSNFRFSFSEPLSESRQLRLPEPRSLCKVERVVEHYISGFSSSNSGTISSRLVLCILDFKLLGHLVSSGFLEIGYSSDCRTKPSVVNLRHSVQTNKRSFEFYRGGRKRYSRGHTVHVVRRLPVELLDAVFKILLGTTSI